MKNKGCRVCGKRVPVRNKQVNFACQDEGLCLGCYMNAHFLCRECGQDIPQGRSVKRLACQLLHLCESCYDAKFPEKVISGVYDDIFEAEINQPSDCPWEWNESIRIMYDETDRYEM